jgi:hypothetical protein
MGHLTFFNNLIHEVYTQMQLDFTPKPPTPKLQPPPKLHWTDIIENGKSIETTLNNYSQQLKNLQQTAKQQKNKTWIAPKERGINKSLNQGWNNVINALISKGYCDIYTLEDLGVPMFYLARRWERR